MHSKGDAETEILDSSARGVVALRAPGRDDSRVTTRNFLAAKARQLLDLFDGERLRLSSSRSPLGVRLRHVILCFFHKNAYLVSRLKWPRSYRIVETPLPPYRRRWRGT